MFFCGLKPWFYWSFLCTCTSFQILSQHLLPPFQVLSFSTFATSVPGSFCTSTITASIPGPSFLYTYRHCSRSLLHNLPPTFQVLSLHTLPLFQVPYALTVFIPGLFCTLTASIPGPCCTLTAFIPGPFCTLTAFIPVLL
jgi:hypothetical protein